MAKKVQAAVNLAKARWANTTAEERSEAARRAGKGNANRDPEELRAAMSKAASAISPEAASERVRKAWITRRAKAAAAKAAAEAAKAARRKKRRKAT